MEQDYKSFIFKVINDVHNAVYNTNAKSTSKYAQAVKSDLIIGTKNKYIGGSIMETGTVKCPHMLHAMLYALRGESCEDILQEMADGDVRVLNGWVKEAKKKTKPELVDKKTSGNGKFGLICGISNGVHLEWDASVAELNKWDAALDTAVKTAQAKQKASKPKVKQFYTEPESGNLWSLQELADNLGMDKKELGYKKAYLLRAHPEYKERVESFFIRKPKDLARYFKSECLAEFKTLLAQVKPYKARATKAKPVREQKTVVKTTLAPKVKKEVKTNTQESVLTLGDINGLADVKALETYLSGLVQVLEQKRQEQSDAETRYDDAMTKLNAAQPTDRAALIRNVQKANQAVVKCVAAAENAQQKLDSALDAIQRNADELRALIDKCKQNKI